MIERRMMIFRRTLEEEAAAEPPVPLRTAAEPEPDAPAAEQATGKGPRILGRPVPPVTRLHREQASRSEGE